MTDGILDIMVLILVLGIVLGACFGFVIPIIDNTQMGFDESLGLIIRLYHSLEKGLANEKFKKEI